MLKETREEQRNIRVSFYGNIQTFILEYEGLHIINTPEVLIQNLQVYLYFP